ncbi:Alpha/Beta hydrolase protein [Chlamydoabsidia padenii]|nr:Alpha/Beta hydrolase protein [Chlamydoabsidia padenii]
MLIRLVGVITLMASAIMARPFTADDLVGLPRPGGVLPSPSGRHAVYAESQYFAKEDKTQQKLYLLDLETSNVQDLTTGDLGDSLSEPLFLDDRHVAYLWKKTSDSVAQLYVVDIHHEQEPYRVTDFPIGFGDIKYNPARKLLTFSSLVYPNLDTLEQTKDKDEEIKKTKKDNALVFDELMVRHWDTFVPEKRNALFVVTLDLVDNKYQLKNSPRNLLKGTGLQSPLFPLGGASDYVVSNDGTEIAFVSKISTRDNAWQTSQHIYTLSLQEEDKESTPVALNQDIPAASAGPSYGPQSGRLAYLQMKVAQFEADRNRIVIYDPQTKSRVEIVQDWDRSPSQLVFSADESVLYAVAEEYGRAKLFAIDLATESITTLTNDHVVSGVTLVHNNTLLFTVSSMNHPAIAHSLDLTTGELHRHGTSEALKTLMDDFSFAQPEEFTFTGALGHTIHSWLVKPQGLDVNKKYPVAVLIHGGPESAWEDSWSTRWNYQVFAQAGYVVIAINPHGSTGYGQDFTDAIQNNWFTHPYEDTMVGLDVALERFDYLDAQRVVALGASYGATMINYINGHTNRFRALVSHDGIFNAVNAYYTTDELYFPEKEFGGPAYEPLARIRYERFSPSNFVHRWKTPTLVIHGKNRRWVYQMRLIIIC